MIGIDLCKIARMEKHVHNERFYRKILTETERLSFIRKPGAEKLAGIFAAKEAASKALGTGIGLIRWKDIEISANPSGQPKAVVIDRRKKLRHDVAISITHDGGFVCASAMLLKTTPIREAIILSEMAKRLPVRPRDAHKGTMGRAVLIGGSGGMSGSMWLCSMAALRTGAGYVYALTSPDTFPALSQKLIEPIVRRAVTEDLSLLMQMIEKADAIGIGPGIGLGKTAKKVLDKVLNTPGCPVVIDADALTLLSENLEWLAQTPRRVVLTPHPGELARLLGDAPNEENIAKFTEKYDMILIEKGASTKVHAENDIAINPTGNPGMATAGSGDVLTGIVTALIAMGVHPVDAAKLGVYVHGLAGDLAREELGEDGMIASDLVRNIPKAMKILREAE